MKTENLIADKSKKFSVRIIKLGKYLNEEKKEFILSKQIIRSGTSIGANVMESVYAQSLSDFHSKLKIALKEALETSYWLDLLHETDYIETNAFESINADCKELIKLLIAIPQPYHRFYWFR